MVKIHPRFVSADQSMASSRKAVLSLAVLSVFVNRHRRLRLVRSAIAQPEQTEADDAEAKATQFRDTRKAERLVVLKNEALANLENGEFSRADSPFLNLATAGTREKIAARDWFIERLMAIGTIDLKGNPSAYEEAVDRAQTSLNLEAALEAKSPMRHYLAAKLAQARSSAKLRAFEQHIAAGTAPGDPVQWCELYQAQLSTGTAADRADSEGTLKSLQSLIPDNLYAQLEWLGVQARRKDAKVSDTLSRVRACCCPSCPSRAATRPRRLNKLVDETRAAAKPANWTTVEGNVSAIVQMARELPEVDADRQRIERGISWHLVSDFSRVFYQKYHVDRSVPSAGKPVQFRELALSGPIADVTDACEAHFVDFDSDGRLEIAVLRGAAFEVFARDRNDQWAKAASVPSARGAYNHFLAVDLGGHQPATRLCRESKSHVSAADFVLFGSERL